MKKTIRFITATLLLSLASIVNAAEPVNTLERKGLFGYKSSGVAIRGGDTVAYWTEGKPVLGSDQFTAEWMGATWKFASQENLDRFTADPEKYAPQYGGYCAYGVAQGALVKIELENWSIIDGKLYLNYDDGVQGKWDKNVPGFIETADKLFDNLLADS